MSGVACAVLAAGASARLGRPKQLVDAGQGETLLGRTLRVARSSACARVAVVLGAHRAQIAAALAGEGDGRGPGGAEVLVNEGWSEGVASSIRVAAAWAEALPCAGLLLLVCDQPLLTVVHLDALVAAFTAGGGAVGSAYAGVLGVPAIFDRARYPALRALQGDRGARGLLHGALAIDWPAGALDVDTEADVPALVSR